MAKFCWKANRDKVAPSPLSYKFNTGDHPMSMPLALIIEDDRDLSIIFAQADLVLIKPISFGQMRDLAKRLRPPDTFT